MGHPPKDNPRSTVNRQITQDKEELDELLVIQRDSRALGSEVRVSNPYIPDKVAVVDAILDHCSDNTYIDASLAAHLELKTQDINNVKVSFGDGEKLDFNKSAELNLTLLCEEVRLEALVREYDAGEGLLVERGPLEHQNITVIDGEVARMTKITKAEAEEKLQETTTRKTQSAVVNHDEELEDHRDEIGRAHV